MLRNVAVRIAANNRSVFVDSLGLVEQARVGKLKEGDVTRRVAFERYARDCCLLDLANNVAAVVNPSRIHITLRCGEKQGDHAVGIAHCHLP